jgi:excinuclease ABC subunit A
MRNTIGVRGAKENNLKNVSLDIPREKLVVLTGLSGSGKSSLAFETIYAEGQRRFLDSMSAFSRKYVAKLKKPDVDFIHGLSPVISIEQKSVSQNPRSTVGTMTDIFDYLRVLFATSGMAHCPYCGREVLTRTATQMAEHILSLPQGTVVEIDAPTFKIYGEDYPYLLGDVRSKGYRRMRVDDELVDISEEVELDETQNYEMDVVIDTVIVKPDIFKQLVVSIENGLRVGEGFLRWRILKLPSTFRGGAGGGVLERWYSAFSCPEHHVTFGETEPWYFSFNEPDSWCRTCLGLGTYLHAHPDLLLPDKSRSIKAGAFIPEAFRYDKNQWQTQMLHSAALQYGFDLDMPFDELSPEAADIVLYGAKGEKVTMRIPDGATVGREREGKMFTFEGIISGIERRYRQHRKEGGANTWMDEWLKKVMVEHTCPDCDGHKLKRQRLMVKLGGSTPPPASHRDVPLPLNGRGENASPLRGRLGGGRNIIELGDLALSELREFLVNLPPLTRKRAAGENIVKEVVARLDLLIGIGLDYMSLNRRASTLSGGESQRIRLSVQIGSELQGMLYVLDEPSIGLHPRDNAKMIRTLQHLRDIGNTVIVVEHDEAMIRAADHIIEIGPGPGAHGGEIVAQGTPQQIIRNSRSLTGQFLSGKKQIAMPQARRSPNGKALVVRGATQNNLKAIDVTIPLGVFICITGVSGSGKSTLINEILYKKLHQVFHDSRTLPGAHAGLDGAELLRDVINIDQTPIGRTHTSNPATYIGVYDPIRALFAGTVESKRRGYTAGRFSFNAKGGRCEECFGWGITITSLQFLPDVEAVCPTCKGKRYNEETLEVTWRGKNIGDVLDMSIEEGAEFFKDAPIIAHKLGVLNKLGMGYLKLGQSSTTISGGEAQRVKLAYELSKVKRGGNILYILDEPTTGLHLADIQRLLDALTALVDAGNTVLVIEHHLDVIKTADWVIDLGPEGGKRGGTIVAQGMPEDVARCDCSYTGKFLRQVLRSEKQRAA